MTLYGLNWFLQKISVRGSKIWIYKLNMFLIPYLYDHKNGLIIQAWLAAKGVP